MSIIKKSLLFFVLFSVNAFATGSFNCQEFNPQTNQVVENGMFIRGVYTWSFGLALVGKVKMRGGAGREEIDLDMSQYKNTAEELYYLSVMDLPEVVGENTVNQRVVLLETKNVSSGDDEPVYIGKLRINYTNFTSGNIPVVCYAEKKKN